MACLAPAGDVNVIYDTPAFSCCVYRIERPDGWVLQISTKTSLTIKDIAIGGQLMRDFMMNAPDKSCYSIFDLRCCEMFTIQQAQALADELREMKPQILAKVVCSAICVSDSSTINSVIKRLLSRIYTPVRPVEVCGNGLASECIRRRFAEESAKLTRVGST